MEIKYKSIGVIHSPFVKPQDTPIQPSVARGKKGTVEIFLPYVEGLRDIDGFSHVVLIYHFHLARPLVLKVKPFLDDAQRGIFATRAPSRPNPIGVSTVRLQNVENNILHVKDLDIIDGTPLLDIKPYVPEFSETDSIKIGWLTDKIHLIHDKKDDGRFAKLTVD